MMLKKTATLTVAVGVGITACDATNNFTGGYTPGEWACYLGDTEVAVETATTHSTTIYNQIFSDTDTPLSVPVPLWVYGTTKETDYANNGINQYCMSRRMDIYPSTGNDFKCYGDSEREVKAKESSNMRSYALQENKCVSSGLTSTFGKVMFPITDRADGACNDCYWAMNWGPYLDESESIGVKFTTNNSGITATHERTLDFEDESDLYIVTGRSVILDEADAATTVTPSQTSYAPVAVYYPVNSEAAEIKFSFDVDEDTVSSSYSGFTLSFYSCGDFLTGTVDQVPCVKMHSETVYDEDAHADYKYVKDELTYTHWGSWDAVADTEPAYLLLMVTPSSLIPDTLGSAAIDTTPFTTTIESSYEGDDDKNDDETAWDAWGKYTLIGVGAALAGGIAGVTAYKLARPEQAAAEQAPNQAAADLAAPLKGADVV